MCFHVYNYDFKIHIPRGVGLRVGGGDGQDGGEMETTVLGQQKKKEYRKRTKEKRKK